MNLAFRLTGLQTAVQTRLQSHFYFADIPVLVEDTMEIENEIDRALGTLTATKGKMGICAVVLTPTARCPNVAAPGPILQPMVRVAVIEDVLINTDPTNGTCKRAIAVVEVVLRLLHRWNSTDFNAALLADATPYDSVQGDRLQYNVNFRTQLALQPITLE